MRKNLKSIFCAVLVLTLFVGIFLSETDVFITNAASVDNVIVGGIPFGVKLYSEGIVIVGFTEIKTQNGSSTPAYEAGLRVNDKITHVNGERVKTSLELAEIIEKSTDEIEITYVRNGDTNAVSFRPLISDNDGKKKTGMWIQDTTAGIGTVTCVVPETMAFVGLGHGICNQDTGELLKMDRGTVVGVKISGVTKGVPGTPGELKGYFTSDKSGMLLKNTLCGVYGFFIEKPAELDENKTVTVAGRNEVKTGKAHILCTVDDNKPQEYEIMIEEINKASRDNRSFLIKVTDERLIEKTGGIVQGMSGSPIIQDGKLIGAVTHVLINDPCRGYGIFIENMLEAAN